MTTPQISVDAYSLSAVRLTMMREDLELAYGSGVLWQSGSITCLVTAWHCLTGTHPETRKSLSANGARPDRVRITLVTNSTGELCEFFQHLYTTGEGSPGWVVHSSGTSVVDIAVLPLSAVFPPQVMSRPINTLTQTDDMMIRVGCDLFILGFPRNLHRLNLPIWKRASLASEPTALLDNPGARHLLVDTATREGMSGGVVIARASGGYEKVDGSALIGRGPFTKIIGIYSGRIWSDDEFAAQIGMVWPIRYVEEIVQSGVQDSFV